MSASVPDLLDRLVATGAVAGGTIVMRLSDVDLIRLELNLRLTPADPESEAAERMVTLPLPITVREIVRGLLERQALLRTEAGTLTATEVERLGRSLMALERQIEVMQS